MRGEGIRGEWKENRKQIRNCIRKIFSNKNKMLYNKAISYHLIALVAQLRDGNVAIKAI